MTRSQTSLKLFRDRHQGDGVVFGKYQSGHAVLSYGSVNSGQPLERLDVACMIEFPDYAALTVTGADSVRFLHGLLTQDIQEMSVGETTRSSMIGRDGRLIALVDLWRVETNTFTLFVPRSHLGGVVDQFSRHRVADRVSWSSEQGRHSTFLFFPSAKGPTNTLSKPGDSIITTACGAIQVQHGPGWPLLRPNRLIQIPVEQMGQWVEYCSSLKVQRVGVWDFDSLRIRSAWPLCGVDATGDFMPLDVGLDQTVSFLKGCFVGSDVLRWVAERGFPNYRWSQIELPELPKGRGPVELLCGEDVVGVLTSWTREPVGGRWIGLGCIQSQPQSSLEAIVVGGGAGRLTCRVTRVETPH